MRSSWTRAAKARLIGAALAAFVMMAGAAAPAMAQERLEQDFGLIKACAGDVWRLCSDVLPDVGKMKSCMQDKMGQLPKACLDKLLDAMAGSTFKVCKDQTYALCAAARCNVYDGVAYCQCEEKHGDSISLPFPMGKGEDVCAVNAAGADNKYMVSTYSTPEQVASPQGNGGVYTCSGGSAGGAYAQCDGGLCFKSTEETTFPGFDKPVPKGQIICSCPITDRELDRRAELSDPRALSVRQVVLQILQERDGEHQHRFDDLCRRPVRHGCGADRAAHRQGGSTLQRVRVGIENALRRLPTERARGLATPAGQLPCVQIAGTCLSRGQSPLRSATAARGAKARRVNAGRDGSAADEVPRCSHAH